MQITESVKKLEAYTPGEQPQGRNILKLNTNENPYPPSPKCVAALRNLDLNELRRYPDPVFKHLRAEIARQNHTSPERVFVGNGSDEILALITRAFVEDNEAIGSLFPTYSLYKTLAAIRNVPWYPGLPTEDKLPAEEDKLLAEEGELPAEEDELPIKKNVSVFFWANPNAPTGISTDPKTIAEFAKTFPGVVVIDEAYADFARENCMHLATALRNKNIIVMRTFSKSYSLAGLRVGWCIGPKALIAALYKVKDSYNVDALAQTVALAALKDSAYMKRNAAKICQTRETFAAELRARGWDVPTSDANFVFARPPFPLGAANIYAELRKRNVFVRYFSTSKETANSLRITIGTDEEMTRALATIDAVSKFLVKRQDAYTREQRKFLKK